jgi:polysaccharide export outer membrane protein
MKSSLKTALLNSWFVRPMATQQPASSHRAAFGRILHRSLWGVALVGMLLVISTGCQSTSNYSETALPAGDSTSTAATATDPAYALQEGDVISVSFEYATNFNAVQKIALDGTVDLELIGPVKAAGVGRRQFELQLAELYEQHHVRDKEITVQVVSSTSSIYVMGAVLRPGKLPMERPMTVLDAIAEAGGFDPNRANLSAVTVLRKENGQEKRYRLNVKRMLSGKDFTSFDLKPFDIVHVPVKTFSL